MQLGRLYLEDIYTEVIADDIVWRMYKINHDQSSVNIFGMVWRSKYNCYSELIYLNILYLM